MLSEIDMTLYSMEWLVADELVKIVKPGDLVEFRRTMPYKHWAVCVEVNNEPSQRTTNNVKLVHLQSQLIGLNGGYGAYLFGHSGQIRIQTLADIHRGKPCRINNVMDQRYVPLGVAQIVQLAVKKEGSSPYNVFYCNSEHFVNSCRYGRHEALEEHFPPLPVFIFLMFVIALLPTPVTLGILCAIIVFTLLCLCTQKLRQERRINTVTDPNTASQPKTIE